LREGPFSFSCSSRAGLTAAADEQRLSEEIENIPQGSAIRMIDLCVLAAGAGHRGEFSTLNVEYLREESARSPEFTCLIFAIGTLSTLEIGGGHDLVSSVHDVVRRILHFECTKPRPPISPALTALSR